MHQEQRQRTADLLRSKGIEQALFTNDSNVRWLTGFAPPVQLGRNFFVGGPPLVWYDDGHFTLVVVDVQADAAGAFGEQTNCELITYLGYTIEQPIDGGQQLAKALRQLFSEHVNSGAVGVEAVDTPIHIEQILREFVPDIVKFTPIDGWLEPLRMIKSAEEIVKLRENFALTDIGHATARRSIAPGKREIDIWTEMHSAIQRAAGQRVAFGNDCVAGYRDPNNMGGWPQDLVLKSGDSLMVDLSTLRHGYWSDSCATYFAGEPTQQQKAMHHTITEALDFAISLVKPGAIAREIDAKVKQFIVDAGYPAYPHHTGHGVGVTGHESPRIVPYCEDVLAEGMVIMLEPGTYVPGTTGVRLEDGLLVTADGAEILTKHDKSLP